MSDTTAEPLHRLVYISRNLVDRSDDDALQRAVAEILGSARRNNLTHDVTGALLFNTEVFAQVLEGPLGAVQLVFEQILVDERHEDVRVLDWAPIEARTFPSWSMAYAGPDTVAAARFDHLLDTTDHDPSYLDGDEVLAVLLDHLGVQPRSSGALPDAA